MQRQASIWMIMALMVGCAERSSADRTTQPTDPEGMQTNQSPTPSEATTEDVAQAELQSETPPDVLVNENNVAAQGYDVVAYHTDGTATQGDPSIVVEHAGARYLFATEEHKQSFQAEPDKYLPAYGGYCAFAVAAQGRRVPPNPESFKVQDGRLMLFTKGVIEGKDVDTLPAWDQDPQGMAQQADANWTNPPH